MKWLFGLLLPVILLIGCSSQSGQKEPAEEVSGEMN
ncbi:proteinase inhibitor, partial [Bacillus velezensis]|nr:proteinase inhibitor [Bacillus velezensis]